MKKINQIEKVPNNRIIVIDDDPDVWEAYKAILAPQQLEGKFTAQKASQLCSVRVRDPNADQCEASLWGGWAESDL